MIQEIAYFACLSRCSHCQTQKAHPNSNASRHNCRNWKKKSPSSKVVNASQKGFQEHQKCHALVSNRVPTGQNPPRVKDGTKVQKPHKKDRSSWRSYRYNKKLKKADMKILAEQHAARKRARTYDGDTKRMDRQPQFQWLDEETQDADINKTRQNSDASSLNDARPDIQTQLRQLSDIHPHCATPPNFEEDGMYLSGYNASEEFSYGTDNDYDSGIGYSDVEEDVINFNPEDGNYYMRAKDYLKDCYSDEEKDVLSYDPEDQGYWMGLPVLHDGLLAAILSKEETTNEKIERAFAEFWDNIESSEPAHSPLRGHSALPFEAMSSKESLEETPESYSPYSSHESPGDPSFATFGQLSMLELQERLEQLNLTEESLAPVDRRKR